MDRIASGRISRIIKFREIQTVSLKINILLILPLAILIL
jgi:hypothetical protein